MCCRPRIASCFDRLAIVPAMAAAPPAPSAPVATAGAASVAGAAGVASIETAATASEALGGRRWRAGCAGGVGWVGAGLEGAANALPGTSRSRSRSAGVVAGPAGSAHLGERQMGGHGEIMGRSCGVHGEITWASVGWEARALVARGGLQSCRLAGMDHVGWGAPLGWRPPLAWPAVCRRLSPDLVQERRRALRRRQGRVGGSSGWLTLGRVRARRVGAGCVGSGRVRSGREKGGTAGERASGRGGRSD